MTSNAIAEFVEKFPVMNELQLKAVFRGVHDVNNLLSRFSKKAIVLREVSVNSAIAAGHVGGEAAALSEVAKQIGLLSIFLAESISEAHIINGNFSNCILNCIVESAKREKLLESLKLLNIEDASCLAVVEIVQKIGNEVSQQLCDAKHDLHRLNPLLNRLQQVIHRTWSIVMNLKVSSGIADDDGNSFFMPIADSLDVIAGECIRESEELLALIKEVDGGLQVACNCAKKGLYAA